MESIQTNMFPYFVPGQVLTHERLNELRRFLDGEVRISRKALTGTGIVCGLTHHYITSPKSVRLDAGYGICSAGYLLNHGCAEISYPNVVRYTDTTEDSPFLIPNSSPLSTIELFELRADNSPVTYGTLTVTPSSLSSYNFGALGPFNTTTINQWVLILYLEYQTTDISACLTGDCDDKGKKVNYRVVPLITTISELAKIEQNSMLNHHESTDVKRAKLRRLQDSLALTQIDNRTELNTAYQTIISDGAAELSQRIAEARDEYGDMLQLTSSEITAVTTAMQSLITLAGDTTPHQYRYDLLQDLLKAYTEFITEAWYFAPTCCEVDREHPRFLLLGRLGMQQDWEFADLRHFFRESPAFDRADKGLLQLRILFKRMLQLINGYGNFDALNTVRITPSANTPAELAERAIPYYYRAGYPGVLKYWNPDLGLRNKAYSQQSYLIQHDGAATPEDVFKNPLKYSLRETPFFRIEGHVNKTIGSALTTIESLRDAHNLPFQVVALSVNSNTQVIKYREVCEDNALAYLYQAGRDEMSNLLSEMKNFFVNFKADEAGCYSKLYDTAIAEISAEGEAMPAGYRKQNFTLNLDPVINKVGDVISAMPASFSSFSYPVFIAKFRDLVEEVIDLKVAIKTLVFKLSTDRVYRYSAPAYFSLVFYLSEPLNWLNQVLDNTGYLTLARAWYQYQSAVVSAASHASLKSWAASHPGMEHLAGVPEGGTFVLVYDETGTTTQPENAPVIADFALPGICCENCETPSSTAVVLPATAFKPVYVEVIPGQVVTLETAVRDVQGETVVLMQGQQEPMLRQSYNVYQRQAVDYSLQLQGDAACQPQYGEVALLQDAAGKPLVQYTAAADAAPGTMDHFTVAVADAVSGTAQSLFFYFLYKSDCVPFIYAKDLFSSVSVGKKVNIYPIATEFMPDVTLSIPTGQPREGTPVIKTKTVTVNSVSRTIQYIEYTAHATFTGIDTFEYQLQSGDQIAFGTIAVTCMPCCAATPPPMVPPPSQTEIIGYVSVIRTVLGTEIVKPEVVLTNITGDVKGVANIRDAQTGEFTYTPNREFFDNKVGETLQLHLTNEVTGQTVTGSWTFKPEAKVVDDFLKRDKEILLADMEKQLLKSYPAIAMPSDMLVNSTTKAGTSTRMLNTDFILQMAEIKAQMHESRNNLEVKQNAAKSEMTRVQTNLRTETLSSLRTSMSEADTLKATLDSSITEVDTAVMALASEIAASTISDTLVDVSVKQEAITKTEAALTAAGNLDDKLNAIIQTATADAAAGGIKLLVQDAHENAHEIKESLISLNGKLNK